MNPVNRLGAGAALTVALAWSFSAFGLLRLNADDLFYIQGKEGTYYASFSDARTAAKAGDTIVLTRDADVSTDGSITFSDKNLTLDLGGHTLTADQVSAISVQTGYTGTITNGTVNCGTGSARTAVGGRNGAIAIFDGTLNIQCTVTSGRSGTALCDCMGTVTVNVQGGADVTCAAGAFWTKYLDSDPNLTVNVSGGSIATTATAPYGLVYVHTSDVTANVNVTGGAVASGQRFVSVYYDTYTGATTTNTVVNATFTGGTVDAAENITFDPDHAVENVSVASMTADNCKTAFKATDHLNVASGYKTYLIDDWYRIVDESYEPLVPLPEGWTNDYIVALGKDQLRSVVISNTHIVATNKITIYDTAANDVRSARLTVGITNSTLEALGAAVKGDQAHFSILGGQWTGNTVDVSIVNSTIAVTNSTFNLGVWDGKHTGERVDIYATNSTFRFAGLLARSAMTMFFDDCKLYGYSGNSYVENGFGNTSGTDSKVNPPNMTLKNCYVTNMIPCFGRHNANATSTITVDGGTALFRDIQYSTGHPGVMILTNNANVSIFNPDSSSQYRWYFPSGNSPGAEFIITGGSKFNLTSHIANPIMRISGKRGASAILRVENGGVFDNTGLKPKSLIVWAGWGDSSEDVIVGEDGTFKCTTLVLGYSGSATYANHSWFTQTGGYVRIDDQSGNNIWSSVGLAVGAASCKNRDCRYILNGGVLSTPWLYATYSRHEYPDNNNWTELSANGGTLRSVNANDYRRPYVVSGLDRASCGPKGFTYDADKAKRNAALYQEFTNIEGEKGLFRKIGAYPLTLNFPHWSTWDVAETRVEEGSLIIGGEDETMATTLVATNATLSLAGSCTNLTVATLKLTDATLEIDPGDRLVVTNAAEISNLTLVFATTPSGALTNDFLIVSNALSEASVTALRIAANNMTVPTGMKGRATVTTKDGKTTVKLTVQGDVAPLAETTTWKGAAADLWNDAANGWTAGVPTDAKVAVFPASETASKTVTVPADATAGALTFADGYTLAGEKLTMPSARGALAIETTAGATEIAAPLELDDVTKVTTAEGSELKLSGDIVHGAFAKDGWGKLVLGGANQFEYALDFTDGITEVADKDALGTMPGWPDDDITLANDTLTFNTTDKSETVLKRGIVIATTSKWESAIIRTDTPATVPFVKSTQGGIIKRGLAPLTVEVAADYSLLKVDPSNYDYCQTLFHYFPANGRGIVNSGAAGANQFLGLSVAEGELCFKAAPGVTLPTVTNDKDAMTIGLHTTNMDTIASFKLDGVYFDAHDKDFYNNGFNNGNHSGQPYTILAHWLSAETRVVNGAVLHVSTFYGNHFGADGRSRPRVFVTNSTIRARSNFYFIHTGVGKASVSSAAITTFGTDDAALESSAIYLSGGVNADLANTYLGPIDHSAYATLNLTGCAFGTLGFRGGSVFRCNSLVTTSLDTRYALTFAFNDAEWQYGTGDFTLAPTLTAGQEAFLKFEMRGKGLVLKPASGTTFTTEYPFTGEGGLIVDGPGTVKFDADTLQFTGAVDLRQGTLDAGGQSVAVTITGTAAPTLKDCVVDGRVLVDMTGASVQEGDVITLANLSGSTTFAHGFRALNLPPALAARFTVTADAVTVKIIRKPGCVMFVR